MPRNAEVIRQWNLLRTLDANRHGMTVDDLVRELNVTKRTVWRDLAALQEVGFALTDEKDGRRTRYKLEYAPFRGLTELGISLVELCSLYMGRAMVTSMAGAPFGNALAAVLKKLEKTLPPKMRTFLDRLPALIEAKSAPVKKRTTKAHDQYVEKLIEGSLDRRVCSMRYHSASRNRQKDYVVHPCRLVHAEGGLYLLAWVPEYNEIRTFAVERIHRLSLTEQRFQPIAEIAGDAFGHSLGVNRGKPEKIVVTFRPRVAPYIRERVWHKSQWLDDLPDGSVRVTMNVCIDWALRSWVLGFGPFAKVEAPSHFAEEILEQLEEAREVYSPPLDVALPTRLFFPEHPRLPGLSRPS
jgi:predicted DNA-binding transcriptional regulator YafY